MRAMRISDLLLPEFDREMKTTRRLLERVPEEKFSFKPHEKSGSLGQLANHIAGLTRFPVMIAGGDSVDIATRPRTPDAATREELLARFDENAAAAREAIAGVSDDSMSQTWTLRFGDRTIFAEPRYTALRAFFMNHHIHHRAQLAVYLRLNDVPLPSMYGPTADEPL
jgi:uncharacterized damage-inducible protein DinB